MLDQGLQQFDVLLSRSFFQQSSQEESGFVMHDLMHDLARSVGGIMYLNVGLGEFDDGGKATKSPEKVRHLSYVPKEYEVCARLEKSHIFKKLRTFLVLPSRPRWGNHLSSKMVKELLQKLNYLRSLSLSGYSINKIPGSICSLKHLRYLNFSECSIKELPETICTLYNLETLILKCCKELTKLPDGIDKLLNLRCLDIEATDQLKKMPAGLVRLHKLEILSKFIVGKEGGLRLKEVKCFQNLQQELLISDLQNVENIGDARDAQLIAKVGLTALTFKWDCFENDSNSRNGDKEMQVLDLLQPHPNIKEVIIHGFGGLSLPQWIGSPSLANLKLLRLSKCQTTQTLPSLGLLPSLTVLDIEEMDAVCTIGPEFFGTTKRPFPSLEVLNFTNMPAWESWSFSSGNREIDQLLFPRLNKLRLYRCPELVSRLPYQLSSLVDLDIQFCPILEASPCIVGFPSLQELKLTDCSHVLLVRISSANLNALTRICLWSMKSDLVYLNGDLLSSLSVVEYLEFDSCDGLIRLWEDNNNAEVVTGLSRLMRLRITRCKNLQNLPDNMQRLTSLRELTITDCSKLRSFPEGMMNCSRLEKLIIERCDSLVCFAEGVTVPATLRTLKIDKCEKLERLPEGIIVTDCGYDNGDVSSSTGNTAMVSQLEELEISNCPSLKPTTGTKKEARMTIKVLAIKHCGNAFDWLLEDGDEDDELGRVCASLEKIDIQGRNVKTLTHCLHIFTNLTELRLWNCPYLEVDVFPQLPSSLKSLSLLKCNKIKCLPQTTSTSLQQLRLMELMSIESLPKEGLPLSLEILTIEKCKELRQPMAEWGLHKLTALKRLEIEQEIGCLQGMTCFPPPPRPAAHAAASDWLMLPPNLEAIRARLIAVLRYPNTGIS